MYVVTKANSFGAIWWNRYILPSGKTQKVIRHCNFRSEEKKLSKRTIYDRYFRTYLASLTGHLYEMWRTCFCNHQWQVSEKNISTSKEVCNAGSKIAIFTTISTSLWPFQSPIQYAGLSRTWKLSIYACKLDNWIFTEEESFIRYKC